MIDANPAEFTFRRRWVGMNEALPTDFRFNGRPLAVIDFEDREQAERLVQALKRAYWGDDASKVSSSLVNAMQAALREFADPKPPRPEEPVAVGALVTDHDGEMWVRHVRGEWACLHSAPGKDVRTWAELVAQYSPLKIEEPA